MFRRSRILPTNYPAPFSGPPMQTTGLLFGIHVGEDCVRVCVCVALRSEFSWIPTVAVKQLFPAASMWNLL